MSFIAPHFIELYRVARAARELGAFEPVLAFGAIYESLGAQAKAAASCGILVDDEASKARQEATGTSPRDEKGLRVLRLRFGESILATPLWLHRERAATQLAGQTLDKYHPVAVVLAEDNVGYATGNWVLAARARKLPVVVIPYTIAGPSEAAESLLGSPSYRLKKGGNRLLSVMFPQWRHCHRGVDMVRLPAGRAFAKVLARTAGHAPWVQNSGRVDAIAVEGRQMETHYRKLGIDPKKLYVTGGAADDTLASGSRHREEWRRILEERLNLTPGRPMLLCALPPDQFSYWAARCEFPSYQEMLRRWVEVLTSLPGWNVVIRPHPRDAERVAEMLRGWNVTVSLEDTASLIPLCDVYVASISATIRWAIACGIPVVNYDCYHLNYGDYSAVQGVIHAEAIRDFADAILRFRDRNYVKAITAVQREVAGGWGELDGHSLQRILGLIQARAAHCRAGSPLSR